MTAVNLNTAIVKDGAGNAANLTGAVTNPAGTLQIDTTAPTVSSVVASPSSGIEIPGNTITLTLNMSEAVTVTGTPTLTLNDGGIATYTAGSGTSALTFSYTVGAGDSNVAALAITQANLPIGATVKDAAGNTANLAGASTTFPALQIDPPPALSSIVESPASGDLNAGHVVTLTLNFNTAVTVAGGTPTLTLNDGGTATYTGGSGSTALTFSYTVAAGQNTASLAVTAINLNAATIKDGAGNAASLSLTGLTQTGPQIDTTTPTVSSVVASGTGVAAGAGDLTTGSVVTLTLNLSEAVTVAGGTPTLTLNDGGTATYTGGSGIERADLQLHGGGRAEHRRPGGDGGQSRYGDRHGRRRQCRQSHRCGDQPGRRPADRHHGTHRVVAGGLRHRHHGRRRRPEDGQRGDADAEPERGGDGRGRHADADAQRRWHRDLHRRLGLERADLQLHGGGRAEHRRSGGDGDQSECCERHGWRRQCRQSHRRGDQPGWHPADRHHGTHSVVGGDVRHRHHGGHRRPGSRQRRHADAEPERGGDGGGRHTDVDPQRRRHRDLYGRLGHRAR